MQLRQGTFLQGGKYRIERVLGQGGFGITYLATQVSLNRKVAIKEFFMKDYCNRDESTSRILYTATDSSVIENYKKKFIKEGLTISSLNHPNIIRIYDNFEENGTAYYAMEYIDGQSVGDILKQCSQFDESLATHYVKGVAAALEYVHAKHINHLDIKPANIMVRNADSSVVLIDFGVAKQYDASTDEGTTSTPVGVSSGYSPLEQYTEGGVKFFSPHSDIYSLGATLYRMVVGTTPPHAAEISQNGFPTLPSTLSAPIRRAIIMAMKPRYTERPQSVQDFIEILDGAQTDDDVIIGELVDKAVDKPVDKQKPNSLPWIIAILILTIAVALGGYFWYTNSHQEPAAPDTEQIDEEEIDEQEEEAPIDNTIEARVYSYSYNQNGIRVKCSIEYPQTSNSTLERNIMEWANESLGGQYQGSLTDPQAFVDFYGQQLAGDDEWPGQFSIHIRLLSQTDKYVTFEYITEMYQEGAAHGMEQTIGATFRKDDGRKFDWNMFSNTSNLQPSIKEGLKQYFDVTSDSDLEENLQLETGRDINSLPLPKDDPWLTPRGMVLHYSEYEIACYAAGQPTFTIPFDKIRSSLTSSALGLIE